MEETKPGIAFVIGKRNQRVEHVMRILSRYFCDVQLISNLNEDIGSPLPDHVNLIVITDTLADKLDKRLMVGLRKRFPQAKILGLFDEIDGQIEIIMRSVGLIFLGSFDHFGRQSMNIFRSAFGSKGV